MKKLGSRAAVGLALFALAACGSNDEGEALDGEALASIVDTLSAELAVPGTLVLVRTPRETFRYAYGSRVAGGGEPITVDDHVRIGSNTKTMTGTVLLKLVDEGALGLDDEVDSLLPGFSAGEYPVLEGVTVRMLLDMSSGLANYSELLAFNQALDDEPDRAWQPEELAALGLAEPAAFPPGQGFLYSNTNTVLAGLIVEELTGEPLRDVLEARLFSPLGLSHTSLPDVTDASLPTPHPRGYMFGTNVATLDAPTLTPAEQEAAREGDLLPNDVTFMNPSWGWAAGAGISTIDDLADYVEALIGGDLLSEALHEARLQSLSPIDPGDAGSARYGLALAQFGTMIGHDGSLPGFQTFMGHDPARGVTLIVATNLQMGPADELPAVEIARALIGEL